VHLFAGLRVRDYESARRWFEQLLGEPAFFPNDTEAVWTLADDRSIYVVEHEPGAGNGVVTIFVDDLEGYEAAPDRRADQPPRPPNRAKRFGGRPASAAPAVPSTVTFEPSGASLRRRLASSPALSSSEAPTIT
jgi:hypothetical protein